MIEYWSTYAGCEVIPQQSLDDAVAEWLETELGPGEDVPPMLRVTGFDEYEDETYDGRPALYPAVTAFVPMAQWMERNKEWLGQ